MANCSQTRLHSAVFLLRVFLSHRHIHWDNFGCKVRPRFWFHNATHYLRPHYRVPVEASSTHPGGHVGIGLPLPGGSRRRTQHRGRPRSHSPPPKPRLAPASPRRAPRRGSWPSASLTAARRPTGAHPSVIRDPAVVRA